MRAGQSGWEDRSGWLLVHLNLWWAEVQGAQKEGGGGSRSGTDSPQGWWSLGPQSMPPTFQSTHESVSRDEPKINGFPVPGGTTPSRGFLEGSVGWLGDRPSGVFGDRSERGRWQRLRGVEREWVVSGGCEEHGGVFEFPKWQQQGEELATPESFHCLLFTRTADSKQWHALSLGTLRPRLELKLTLEIRQWAGLPPTSNLRCSNTTPGLHRQT